MHAILPFDYGTIDITFNSVGVNDYSGGSYTIYSSEGSIIAQDLPASEVEVSPV